VFVLSVFEFSDIRDSGGVKEMLAKSRLGLTVFAVLAILALLVGCAAPPEEAEAPAEEEPMEEEAPPAEEPAEEEAPAEEAAVARWEEPIVIGWTPPDITGVFKTATDFFELAAEDANAHGFDVQVISQSPATHVAFADQVAIIEDYIERDVDVIAISPIEVEVIKPAVQEANAQGIPVIIVNLLEPIEGLDIASYIGFDNTIGARWWTSKRASIWTTSSGRASTAACRTRRRRLSWHAAPSSRASPVASSRRPA
jgi:ABC-type sugar transport system substrate-binding protein